MNPPHLAAPLVALCGVLLLHAQPARAELMDWHSTERVFGFVWLVASAPIYMTIITWAWMRRSHYLMAARLPILMLLTNLSLWFYSIQVNTRRIFYDEYPCAISLWSDMIGLTWGCNCYAARVWLVFIRHERAHQFYLRFLSEKGYSVPRDADPDLEWDVKRQEEHLAVIKRTNSGSRMRRAATFTYAGVNEPFLSATNKMLARNSFILGFMLLVSGLLYIFPLALSLSDTETVRRNGSPDDCKVGFSNVLLFVYGIVYAMFFVPVALKIRKVVDGFYLTSELRMIGISFVIMITIWIAWILIPPMKHVNNNVFPFSSLVANMFCLFALIVSGGLPIYRTYQAEEPVDVEVAPDLETLGGLLSIPDGVHAFRQFLVREFSVENLLFWEDVNEFKTLVLRYAKKHVNSPARVQRFTEARAREIYDAYMSPSSPMELNLSANIREQIDRVFASLPSFNKSASTSVSSGSSKSDGMLLDALNAMNGNSDKRVGVNSDDDMTPSMSEPGDEPTDADIMDGAIITFRAAHGSAVAQLLGAGDSGRINTGGGAGGDGDGRAGGREEEKQHEIEMTGRPSETHSQISLSNQPLAPKSTSTSVSSDRPGNIYNDKALAFLGSGDAPQQSSQSRFLVEPVANAQGPSNVMRGRMFSVTQQKGDEVGPTLEVELPELAAVFDWAQNSIFKLMSTDSFVRFRHTKAYRTLATSVDVALTKKEALEKASAL